MALRPQSFIYNPFLLFVLCASMLGVVYFATANCTTSCPSTRMVKPVKVHTVAPPVQVQKAAPVVAEDAKGWLGIHIQTLNGQRAKYAGVKANRGVLILGLQEQMPAQSSGFQPYDVVTHFHNQVVTNVCQLKSKVADTAPGTRVPVRVNRNGASLVLYPTLSERPAQFR